MKHPSLSPARRGSLALASAVALAVGVLSAGPARSQGNCLWEPVGDAPFARVEPRTFVVDGKMIVLGGYALGLIASKRVDVYDPLTDSWSTRPDMPIAVTHCGAARDKRTLWIAGGFVGDNPGPVTDQVFSYDVDAQQWTARPPLPAIRGSGGLFVLDRGLHFVGGVAADRDTDQVDHWVLDLDNPAAGWSASTPMPVAHNHFGTLVIGQTAWIIGGQVRHDTSPTDLDVLLSYDLVNGWQQHQSLPIPRSHFEPGTFELDGRIAIAGGRSKPLGLEKLDLLSVYDPATDAWSELDPLPQALVAPAAARIGLRIVLSSGGPDAAIPVLETTTRPVDPSAPLHRRVNAGGAALGLAQWWCADQDFVGGATLANSGFDVAGTQDDALYLAQRTAAAVTPQHLAYAIPIANGAQRVRLHFAEIFFGAPNGGAGGVGKRVFDVSIEGQTVLAHYDITAAVGALAADVREFDVVVADGVLDLSLDASVDKPALAAYEILYPGSAAVSCPAQANSVGAGAMLTVAGSLNASDNDVTLLVSGCPPVTSALFLQSLSQATLPFGAGTLCVAPPLFRLLPSFKTTPAGTAMRAIDLTSPSLPPAAILGGSTWTFQLWYRDAALGTFNLSNGLELTFGP